MQTLYQSSDYLIQILALLLKDLAENLQLANFIHFYIFVWLIIMVSRNRSVLINYCGFSAPCGEAFFFE